MQIGKRLFPYPILNNAENYNCYKSSNYSLEYIDEETKDNYILKNVHIETNNGDLKNMILNDTLNAVVIVECSSTIYKHIEKISFEPKDIVIPLKNLNGRVEISSLVYSNKNIEDYTNYDLLEDYNGYKFSFEESNILAIDDGFVFNVEYDDSVDKKVSSIFLVIKSLDEKLDTMKVVAEERKIRITLPEKEFNFYDKLKYHDNFMNIFFSIIVIPALSICLNNIQRETEMKDRTLEEIREQYIWFGAIQKAYSNLYGKELEQSSFLQLDILSFSQKIINNCVTKAITDFKNIVTENREEIMEEE
ncbi:MAG: hypothetical protein PHX04_00525 [Bacilli bacterium]|nr:hypothetical protein [Bacilli bacterium]